MNEKKSTFAERLTEAIKLRGIKQVDLCEATKIPKSAMSQYMNGGFVPKQDRLWLISNALNVSEAWLMGYDVPMDKEPSYPNDNHLFQGRLKQVRESKGVYQKDVANAIGVDRTTYVKYERGDSEPNFQTINKLADYFGVSVDYLLGRKTEKDESFSLPIDKAVVAARLQALRKEKKISQQSLADHVGMNQSTINQWECGVAIPPADIFRALGKLYGVSVSYLLGISDDPEKAEQKEPEHNPIGSITLTKEDQADISRDFERIKERLENADGLMLDGNPLTDEARASILASIRTGMELAVLQIKKEEAEKALKKNEGKE